jgi:hypothetical protein
MTCFNSIGNQSYAQLQPVMIFAHDDFLEKSFGFAAKVIAEPE